MGFYKNINSDPMFIKQMVDDIFISKYHTCHDNNFICIFNNEKGSTGFWYHAYRIDDFTIKLVKCTKTFRSNGGVLGPAYHLETDVTYNIDMFDMLSDQNRHAYQAYRDSNKAGKGCIRIEFCGEAQSRIMIMDITYPDITYPFIDDHYTSEKFFLNRI